MNAREVNFTNRLRHDLDFSHMEVAKFFAQFKDDSRRYSFKFASEWLRNKRHAEWSDSPFAYDDLADLPDSEPTLDDQHHNQGNQTMNINHTITALQDFNTVGVRFADSDRTYTYKTTEKFEEGDKAIVCPNGMLKVVTVKEVHETPQIDFGSNIEYKWIVQKVDLENYSNRMKQEELMAVELRKSIANKKREEVKAELVNSLGVDDVNKLTALIEHK